MRNLKFIVAVLALVNTACATGVRCTKSDLGGWMIGDAHGVHHSCHGESERFVLRAVVHRREDGGVAEWSDLAALDIPLRRGESTMYGFECGSDRNVRDDAIAVVQHLQDGSFTVKRAWIIDAQNRTFVKVPADGIVCESLE